MRQWQIQKTILPKLISDNELLSYEIDQQPYDIGTPDRYNRFIKRLRRNVQQQ